MVLSDLLGCAAFLVGVVILRGKISLMSVEAQGTQVSVTSGDTTVPCCLCAVKTNTAMTRLATLRVGSALSDFACRHGD